MMTKVIQIIRIYRWWNTCRQKKVNVICQATSFTYTHTFESIIAYTHRWHVVAVVLEVNAKNANAICLPRVPDVTVANPPTTGLHSQCSVNQNMLAGIIFGRYSVLFVSLQADSKPSEMAPSHRKPNLNRLVQTHPATYTRKHENTADFTPTGPEIQLQNCLTASSSVMVTIFVAISARIRAGVGASNELRILRSIRRERNYISRRRRVRSVCAVCAKF